MQAQKVKTTEEYNDGLRNTPIDYETTQKLLFQMLHVRDEHTYYFCWK